jgi:hypothetical protein
VVYERIEETEVAGMDGKLIKYIEREFEKHAENLIRKLYSGRLDAERCIWLMSKLKEWYKRFDDLIFVEVGE